MDYSQQIRIFEKLFVPGSETLYVEFCEFDRPGRDEYNRDRLIGGKTMVNTLLREGVSDFLLPAKPKTDGTPVQAKHTGTDADFKLVWDGISEEFEQWLLANIARINKIRDAYGNLVVKEDDPGNSASSATSPSEPSGESSPDTTESATPESVPS